MQKFTGERALAYGYHHSVDSMSTPGSQFGEGYYLPIGLEIYQRILSSTPTKPGKQLADPVTLYDNGIEVSFQSEEMLYYGEHAGAVILGTYRANYPNAGIVERDALASFERPRSRGWLRRRRPTEAMRVTFYEQGYKRTIQEPSKGDFNQSLSHN